MIKKPKLYADDSVLMTLLDYGSDIIICLNQAFSITKINQRAEKFYQWQSSKVIGKSYLQLCKRYAYPCPINENFFANPKLFKINLNVKNFADKECNIDWIINPLTDIQGAVTGAVIIGKNIDIKKNNIAYYLNGIIDSIPGCLYWKDCNGRYLGCNNLTAKLAGLNSVQEIVGKTDKELWGEQAEFLVKNDKQVLENGDTVYVEEKLQADDGRWFYFTGIKMPLKDENDKVIGIIGNSLDITELKTTQIQLKQAKEEAEALSKAKSNFIANMSHDVKTPLSGIIGLSEVLLGTLHGNEYELAQNIMLSGKGLLSFFDNCVDMAKSEGADISLREEQFDLKGLLDEITTLFKPAAQSRNLDFSLRYDKNIPPFLEGSRVGIYRVVLNLIGNAIKFTHKGKVVISAKLSNKSTKTQVLIQFMVEDTGIGIPKDKQKVIFERFTRLVPSYKGTYEGSGIGLYLVDRFVKAMGGEIHVDSKEGRGSRFVVAIPLKIAEFDEREPSKDIKDIPALLPSKQKKKSIKTASRMEEPSLPSDKLLSSILLVEDNAVAQMVAQLMLSAVSNKVDLADCGSKALSLFKNEKYDLVFLDIGLPDISGTEVAVEMRKIEKGDSHIPIIALTAHASDEVGKTFLETGIDEVFEKPLSHEKLQQVINQYGLDKKKNINNETEKQRTSVLGAYPILEKNVSKEMLKLLMESIPDFTLSFESALKRNDINSLQKAIHKFRGGACYTGTPQLLKAAENLENAIKNGENHRIDALYQGIKDAIDAFINAYYQQQ